MLQLFSFHRSWMLLADEKMIVDKIIDGII
jgi:hypothetical protein